MRSRLIDSLVLDVGVGILPLGPANPQDLPSPLSNIPSYAIGLSLHPELQRHSRHVDRSEQLLVSAPAQRRFAVRGHALLLLRTLGELAASSLRWGTDLRLATQAKSAPPLAREDTAKRLAETKWRARKLQRLAHWFHFVGLALGLYSCCGGSAGSDDSEGADTALHQM